MSFRAFYAQIHLDLYDKMRTTAEVIASRRGRVYTDEDHERERERLKARLAAAKLEPDYVADPYP